MKRPPKTWGTWAVNWLVPWVIILAAMVGIGVLKGVLRDAEGGAIFLIIPLVFIGIFFVFKPIELLADRRKARYRMWTAAEELRAYKGVRPILYLRSFGLDIRFERSLSSLLGTAEIKLANLLRQIGPLIAIGRPEEHLPPLGAARLYLTENLWRQKLADMVSVSQMIVWTTGVGEGLRWELTYLLKHVPPERLIVWAHPQILFAKGPGIEKEWTEFRNGLGQLFPKPLPEALGATEFITFKPDFEPVPVAPSMKNVSALFDVLVAKQIPPFDPATLAAKARRVRRRWLVIGIIVAIIIAYIVAVATIG